MSALRIFVSVYTLKFSTEAPTLMKHGELVQDLPVKNHKLKFYYKNFRFLRQGPPQLYPLGNIQWELWFWARVNDPNHFVKSRCHYSNRGTLSCLSADGRNLWRRREKCAALSNCDAEVRNGTICELTGISKMVDLAWCSVSEVGRFKVAYYSFIRVQEVYTINVQI